MTQIASKTILITGGAQGMGRLLAQRCIEKHAAKLILWDINEGQLGETVSTLSGKEADVTGTVVNVRDGDAVAAAAEEAGHVDILVNNAGIVAGKPLAEQSHADIDRTIGVNVSGVIHTTRAFLPDMLAHGGHIVNMASASGYIPLPRLTTYAASKWACLGFSESLRVELRDQPNVQVTTVCPSYIDTGMFDGVRAPIGAPLLTPDYAVSRILRAIEEDQAKVNMPWLVHLMPLCYNLLPSWIFEPVIGRGLGVYRAMDHFRGHGDE